LKKYKRSDYILQTKVAPKENPEEFRAMLLRSFAALQIDMDDPESFIDLFSFHGVNKPEHLVQIQRDGGCMEVVKEYQQKGKIRFIGFSTHGMTPLIVETIETGLFDYVNLHYHFIGSYTASGTGETGGNLAAIHAAQRQDMGVFIISPSDKGGALYEPSKTFERACQPLTPIAFNNLWLWSNDPPIHTLVIGAARPADIDEHLSSTLLYDRRKEVTSPIAYRLYSLVDAQFGADYRNNWWHGLPDPYSNPEGISFPHLIWLHMVTKAWGLHKFAQLRYQNLEGNIKDWKEDQTLEVNLKSFSWVPGLSYRPERLAAIREALGSNNNPRCEEIMERLQEVHQWLHSGGCFKRGETPVNITDSSGWVSAYNLQPDVPFPERTR
jgi:predicted aldo/keto reductase-like oxidoreductase